MNTFVIVCETKSKVMSKTFIFKLKKEINKEIESNLEETFFFPSGS